MVGYFGVRCDDVASVIELGHRTGRVLMTKNYDAFGMTSQKGLGRVLKTKNYDAFGMTSHQGLEWLVGTEIIVD